MNIAFVQHGRCSNSASLISDIKLLTMCGPLCFFVVSKLNRGKIALATFTILAGSQVEEAQQRGGGVTIKVARVESTEDLREW